LERFTKKSYSVLGGNEIKYLGIRIEILMPCLGIFQVLNFFVDSLFIKLLLTVIFGFIVKVILTDELIRKFKALRFPRRYTHFANYFLLGGKRADKDL